MTTKTKTTTAQSDQPAPSPIRAMAERLGHLDERRARLDELGLAIMHQNHDFRGASKSTVEGWAERVDAEISALQIAILQAEPADLADVTIMSIVALFNMNTVTSNTQPIRGETRDPTIELVHEAGTHCENALHAIVWRLLDITRESVPAGFLDCFLALDGLAGTHGPALTDLPKEARTRAAA